MASAGGPMNTKSAARQASAKPVPAATDSRMRSIRGRAGARAADADEEVGPAGENLLELHAEVALAEEARQRHDDALLLSLDSGVTRNAHELGGEIDRRESPDLGIDDLQQVGVGHDFSKCNARRETAARPV